MNNNNKIGIVYVTYDGAINSTSGVGVVSGYFISQFPIIAARYVSLGVHLTLEVVCVSQNKTSHGYSEEIKLETESICKESGGMLRYVDNGTKGDWGYGDYDNWQIASSETAEIISELSNQYDQLVVFLVDTPFLGVPYYLNRKYSLPNVKLVLTPHSDLFSHFTTDFAFNRLQWEAACLQMLNIYDNVFLAQTSKYLLKCFRQHYLIPDNRVIPMQTGLVLGSRRFKMLKVNEKIQMLNKFSIPTDCELIFSVGRAVGYKGIEDLIKSFSMLKGLYDKRVHLVFIASPYLYKGSASNVIQLKKLIAKYKLEDSCTPIFKLDMELPITLSQWKNTKIVAQLSNREPFGLIPEEVRLWARKGGPVVLASNVGGHVEQITDGVDGYLVEPSHHIKVAEVFKSILQLDTRKLGDIRANGINRVTADYNYTDNVMVCLERLLDDSCS